MPLEERAGPRARGPKVGYGEVGHCLGHGPGSGVWGGCGELSAPPNYPLRCLRYPLTLTMSCMEEPKGVLVRLVVGALGS